MRIVNLVALILVLQLSGAGPVLAQKPEVSEVDAWLVRDPQMSAQFAVADQMGYFKEQGLKLTPRWYIAGTDLPSMWGAGNIHLGTATASMVIPIAASGTMAIEHMARDLGVDFSKIQFVNLSPPDSVTALAKGDIDAMAGWAPWVFTAIKNGGKVYFTGNKSYIPGKEGQVDWILVHAGVIASGKMLKENPNTLKAVLRALEKATTTINTEREATVKIVAREMKMDEGLARDIMALNVYSMELTDKHVKGMGQFVDFLHSLNRIPQKPAPEGLFYTKLLKDVDAKLVKWESKTEPK